MRRGTAMTGGVLLLAGTVLTGPVTGAVGADTLVTTSSTVSVDWQPRVEGESEATIEEMRDWTLRVSQTEDLLNQTVEVSWTGAATSGNGLFVQLMQCWSDGPDDPPTRERCAFGGIDAEGAGNTGQGRTRALSGDPRERQYRNDGGLDPVTVDGAPAGPTWTDAMSVVLGTNAGRPCPTGTQGYELRLVPPAGATPFASVVLQDSATPPAPLALDVGGFPRTYAATTGPVSFGAVAVDLELAQWPLGEYRTELSCRTGDEAGAVFVGFLERVDQAGAAVWRRSARTSTGITVPFDPVGESAADSPTDPFDAAGVLEFLKPRTTNELWQARTRPDGAGQVFMEVFTDLEAQHLGCGRVEGSAPPRTCWVVAVPRWGTEPGGDEAVQATLASPLSQTLWDRRIEVPLEFAPVASGCEIGSGLKQVLTNDSAIPALRSWQPLLCDDPSTAASVLGPLQDFSVRQALAQPNRMGVVGVPDAAAPATEVRAPIATSAVVVGFVVDRQIPYGAEDYARNETRSVQMNLTPRLVAKLLTQSYDSGAAPNGGKTEGYNASVRSGAFQPTFTPARSFPPGNPRTLYQDPEFLDLNPDFAVWVARGSVRPNDMADLLVSSNDTDAYQVLWQWVVSDPAATAFLGGQPDEHGMLINPYYQDQVGATTSTFPLLDPTCADVVDTQGDEPFPLLCQTNLHPRVEDDTEAAQAAVRGDTRRFDQVPAQITGNVADLAWRAEPRQDGGRSAVLVVTTSAVAERFGLPTASLRNAGGTFVPATTTSMSAARGQMTVREDGVLVPAPAGVTGEGYPLTTMAYAAVDVAATTQDQNDAFATLLAHAGGRGQEPGTSIGQLPPGYAPLDDALRAQVAAAVALLRDPSSLLQQPAAPGEEAAAPGGGDLAPGAVGPVPGGLAGPGAGAGAGVGPDAAVPPAAAGAAAAPEVDLEPVRLTAGTESPLQRLLPVLIGCALAGLLVGPLLTLLAGRRP